MKTSCLSLPRAALAFAIGLLPPLCAEALVVQDNFTGTQASTSLGWVVPGVGATNGACLTAGEPDKGTHPAGGIPACVDDPYYTSGGVLSYGANSDGISQTQAGLTSNKDQSGSGALRLTNGCATVNDNKKCYYQQAGAIISSTPFPSNQGVQVTFTTYTYGGDNSGGHGADGIGFYLLDADALSQPPNVGPNFGAWGGSLGYSCSNTNTPYDGMVGAYLGLGMDEYGNFLNGTVSGGQTCYDQSCGDNTSTGYGYSPGRIGLRGAGNISWTWLNYNYPQFYPSSLSDSQKKAAVKNTCSTGHLWNYGTTTPDAAPTNVPFTCSYTTQTTMSWNQNDYSNLRSCNNTSTQRYYPSDRSEYYSNERAADAITRSCTTGHIYNYYTYDEPSDTGRDLGTSGTACQEQCIHQTTTSTTVSTTYRELETANSTYYPQSLEGTATATNAVSTTCPAVDSSALPSSCSADGSAISCDVSLYDFSSFASGDTGIAIADYSPINFAACPYTSTSNTNSNSAGACAFVVLPATTPIADEVATNRADATPITYKLQIVQNGLLSLWYSYNGGTYTPVLTNQQITSYNGPLPNNFLFGFGGSTGGSNNVHEITCFQATPANVSASSAGVNVQQSGEIETGTQVYLAYYHTDNWWGQLTSQDLVLNETTGVVSISPTANWDASCVLTGGACPATGATTGTVQGPDQRTILSWCDSAGGCSNAQGIPLSWDDLTSTQQGWLQDSNGSNGENRLAFLRGDRSNEITTAGSGIFRHRTGVLGDIVDSSPTWVGPPTSPYPATWADSLHPSATPSENSTDAQTYPEFKTTNATRLNVVYDGANDGFLHGFRTGSYESDGTYVADSTTPNDGREVLAYMPQAVLNSIHRSGNSSIDFSSAQYSHAYYVDATPGTGDLFYDDAWHTWLVSGLGTGGSAIFALDVTDPSTFTTTSASTLVRGEWTPDTLFCANSSTCGANLGETHGTPQIRRLHNGQWGVVFGNGLNSANGHAGIYVMIISSSGTITSSSSSSSVYFLDTGVGTAAAPNGINWVTPADMDGDHITDYVYGGDYNGNVWRFDLTSDTPSNWAVSKYGKSTATPLFTTPSGQPITTQVMVLSVPRTSTLPYVMLEFGTGAVKPQTASSPAVYAYGQQALYGVWDWDMGSASAGSGWNSLLSIRYASLTGTSSAPSSITTSSLQSQTVTSETSATSSGAGQGYRTLSHNPVCFVGESCATTTNGTTTTAAGTQFGWYLNLPGYMGVNGVDSANQTEQIIYSPILANGAFFVNTTVPSNNSPLTCTIKSVEGWTMAINPLTGGSFGQSIFADSSGNFVNINGGAVSGIALGATGSPRVVTANKHPYLVSQTVNGVGTVNQISPPAPTRGGRLTWVQLY